MSFRDLDALFRPKSIALIGASNRPKSIGNVVMRNLLQAGFSGPILPVNPRYKAVLGVLTYASIEQLPVSPELAIICTPPQTVPEFVRALGEKKSRVVLVMSTDLDKEEYKPGISLRQAMLDIAGQYSLRILGPNCLGIINPRSGLNASFGHTGIGKGKIAFVSQSDSLGIAVLDWARSKGIGFSHFISLGDGADIDFDEVIDYLGSDPYTTSILLYIEHLYKARKFVSAARSSSRNKPLLVIKSDPMHEQSHTLSLPGGYPVYTEEIFDGLFRRAGMLRVFSIAELFDAVETLAKSKPLRGEKLVILSNGGAPAIMVKDILKAKGSELANLNPDTLEQLQERLQDNFFGSNPLRIIDHASSDIYAQALEILLKDKDINAIMVIHVPTAFASSEDIAGAIVNIVGGSQKNIYTVWLGEEDTTHARRIFALAGIPTYNTPDQAAYIFMDMVRYRRNQELLMETPDSVPKEFTPDYKAARTIIQNALQEGKTRLTESETKEILSVYTIPVVDTRVVDDLEEASLMARELGYPVALKLLSRDIVSKQEVGGVALDLETPEEIDKYGQAMLSRIKQIRPQAEVQGFIVQKMARRPDAHELMLGIKVDPQIGPFVVFGQGGSAARIIRDQSVGLPPLNMTLAKELIQHTQIAKLLQGHSGLPGADMYALRLTLVQLSQLIIDIPEITALNINPLLADSSGVLVLDAQIEIASCEDAGQDRLAIRPYPEHLEEKKTLKNGQTILLRPIRPEDESIHLAFFQHLSHEDRRMRFFGSVHEFSHTQLAKYTQIDYDREMAFIATTDPEDESQELQTLGVIRAYFEPDNTSAEYAVVVRSDYKGQGLGSQLMQKMISYCRARKTQRLVAYTLKENQEMQDLGKKFDFEFKIDPHDAETIELILELNPNQDSVSKDRKKKTKKS